MVLGKIRDLAVQDKSNELRIRYKYRSLIMRHKVHLTRQAAVKLVGPDCAYHLYSHDLLNKSNMKHNKRDESETLN